MVIFKRLSLKACHICKNHSTWNGTFCQPHRASSGQNAPAKTSQRTGRRRMKVHLQGYVVIWRYLSLLVVVTMPS